MTRSYLLESERFVEGSGLPLTDRAFRYGMSVFETVAIRGGRALLLEPHLAKLAAAVERVKFRPPLEWTDAARGLLAAPPIREGTARIYITAGDGGANLEVARSRAAVLLEESSIPSPAEVECAPALSLPFIPQLPPGKTGNYWPRLIANVQAGKSEAVLVTPEGTVIGAAMANFFVLIGGEIRTPKSTGDSRVGTVSDWVSQNFRVDETHLTLADLERIEDAFLTNSRVGILRISNLDEIPLPGHPLVDEIWHRYRSEVLHAERG